MEHRFSAEQVAGRLVALYEVEFGGKERGRYRFPMKLMRWLTGRKRVSEEMIRNIAMEVFELGYVLVDMETFFVVLSQGTFRSYRRASEDALVTTPIKERNDFADVSSGSSSDAQRPL